MTSKNKAKGSQYERDIVKALNDAGFPKVERMYGAGRQDDRGDIRGLEGWTIEAKNHAKIDLPTFLAELKVEMANAKTRFGACLIKKRGKGVSESYVVIPYDVLLLLLKETNA
jgi:Holliday junction resolvase